MGSFRAGAVRAARMGRKRFKGMATKVAQFACAPELLLNHKVEVIAPALPRRQFYKATLPAA